MTGTGSGIESELPLTSHRRLFETLTMPIPDVRWWYRYFYFRLYKWFLTQKTDSPDPQNVAAYLLCILTSFHLNLLAVLSDVIVGTSLLISASKPRVVWEALILFVVLYVACRRMLIGDDKMRASFKEFSVLEEKRAITADRVYKVFLASSGLAFLFSMIIAALVGQRN